MRILFAALGLAVGLNLLALPANAAQSVPDGTVAIIDGDAVSEEEFSTYLRSYMRSKLFHGGSQERIVELANEAIENLVVDHLLLAEADRRAIQADPDVVAKRLEAVTNRYRDTESWPQVEDLLPKIRGELEDQARIEQLKQDTEQVAEPSEPDILEYYRANPNLFTQPRAFNLDLILIGVPPSARKDEWTAAQSKAQELHASLLAGERFAELARRHSTGATAQEGGTLGLVHAGQLVPSAEELVANTPAGGVTTPIRLLDGIAIFQVNQKIQATVRPFDTVRDRAAALLQRNLAQQQWSDLVSGLRARADVTLADISSLGPKLMQNDGVK